MTSDGLPEPRAWFLVEGCPREVFCRPANGEARTFPAPIGPCIEARRCRWTALYDLTIWPDGEREWVQVSRITREIKSETLILEHVMKLEAP